MFHIPYAGILKLRNVFLLFVEMALLAGCATGVDRAVFVTKTSVSILDVDSTPPGVSIAYDRVEGFIGPAFESGGAPPAIAIIKSDGAVFAPKMRQLYATGNAARVVAGVDTNRNEDQLVGKPKLMLFGTSTSIGLKVGIDATTGGLSIPNNFVFGFRRKEFSLLPLGTIEDKDTKKNIRTYPSVLASIDNTVDTKIDSTGKNLSGGMTTVQYFATGAAATALAKTYKGTFIAEGRAAFVDYTDSISRQESGIALVLRCYLGLMQASKLNVWNDAQRHGLFADSSGANQDDMIAKSKTILKEIFDAQAKGIGSVKDEDKLAAYAKADAIYAAQLMNYTGGEKSNGELRGSALREQLLRVHREYVCSGANK